MAKLVKHSFKTLISGAPYDFVFLAPQGSYAGIEAETGVSLVAEDDPILSQFPVSSVEELLLSPVASSRARYSRCKSRPSSPLIQNGT